MRDWNASVARVALPVVEVLAGLQEQVVAGELINCLGAVGACPGT